MVAGETPSFSAASVIEYRRSAMPGYIRLMESLRPPVRCPHCNGQPSWKDVLDPDRPIDLSGKLGTHPILGWRCNICGYFLAVSQYES